MKSAMKNALFSILLLSVVFSANASEFAAQFSDSVGGVVVNPTPAAAYVFDTIDIPSPNITMQNGTQVTVSRSGLYQVSYSLSWGPDPEQFPEHWNKTVRTVIHKNGAAINSSASYGKLSPEGTITNNATFFIELSAGDYMELMHRVHNGGAWETASIPGESWISVKLEEPASTSGTSCAAASQTVVQYSDSAGDLDVNVAAPAAYVWDTVDQASAGIALSGSEITVSEPGLYRVSYSLSWRTLGASGAAARRQIRTSVIRNGTDEVGVAYGYARQAVQAENATNSASVLVNLNAGDTIELLYQRDSDRTGQAFTNAGESWIVVDLIKASGC